MTETDLPDAGDQSAQTAAPAPDHRDGAHVVVFGNEKGGSGKSTAAMHVAIALLRLGYRVGTIDLDARQGTLTRYMKNRFDHIARSGADLPSPQHMAIPRSEAETVEAQHAEERAFLDMALQEMGGSGFDFVVIDTPGTDSHLSRIAHACADILVTPMNDSFVDLDLLARIDPETMTMTAPSVYTRMVRNQTEGKPGFRWIVMRNRLSHIDARNKREMGALLETLSRDLDFELAPGFGERVIFRELFLKGMTLLDLREDDEAPLTLSELAARQEVRQLIATLHPERYKGYPNVKRRRSSAAPEN